MLLTTEPCFLSLAGSNTLLVVLGGSSGRTLLYPVLAGAPLIVLIRQDTRGVKALWVGVEGWASPRESQHLPVSLASDSSQGPPHSTAVPLPFTARTGGWCPPGGDDGDSGEKELRPEVDGSFCLGCHTPVTG